MNKTMKNEIRTKKIKFRGNESLFIMYIDDLEFDLTNKISKFADDPKAKVVGVLRSVWREGEASVRPYRQRWTSEVTGVPTEEKIIMRLLNEEGSM